MHNTIFTVTNITCDACVKLSEKALKKLAGVETVVVDKATGKGQMTASVPHTAEEIVAALASVKKEVANISIE